MKTQIEKLIDLAKAYRDFGIEVKLPDSSYNYLHTPNKPKELFRDMIVDIAVYFGDGRATCSVRFGRCEIEIYRNIIVLPFEADEQYLTELHDYAEKHLADLKGNFADKMKEENEKKNNELIEKLEKQLENLKKSV